MKKVILITWLNGSGKWTLSEYLHERYGAILYRFSSPLYAILSDIWLPNTRDNLDTLSRSLREQFGQDIMGRGVRQYIQTHSNGIIVLDGIRRFATMQEFRELIDVVIWIEASADTRYLRISQRSEKSGEFWMSQEEFDRQESLESERELLQFREIADIVIYNNWTINELYSQIDEYIKPSAVTLV